MKAFWNPVQLEHAPLFFLQRGVVRRNFEVPARGTALLDACRTLGLDIVPPDEADRGALTAVHTPDYLDFLRDGPAAWAALAEAGPELVPNIHPSAEMLANGARPSGTIVGQVGWYTADTSCPVAASTWKAAAAAASGAIAAADEAGAGRHAYALARPPGHHAYAARAGGHCYLNNAAIAAQRLRDRGAARVAVLDIDSHHGNGTQGIFWDRADVVFASVHGDPRRAAPDALVVSLGFDASEHEPLGFLAVTSDGFARAGAAIGALGLPCALIQEGGYNTDLIGSLLGRFLNGLAGS
jgi:acetoin utilization deacetylase AcuC-like enzyme